MDDRAQGVSSVHGIDLAEEADFELGSLRVRPAKCEVEADGAREILQRRVMQVLVALAHADGSVVSQGELVARCWRGLTVTDDAIVRCISKLRKLAARFPQAPFAIETIPGVGYLLTSPGLIDAREKDVAGNRHFRFVILWVAAAMTVVAIASGLALIAYHRGPVLHGPTRVAVQSFETLGSPGDPQALAKGIPNAIVDALADSQVEAALTDGAREANANPPSPGLIVTGILRRDGINTNVDVRIEDGAARTALWSTEFTRRNNQTSDLPLEIAARVTDVINMINFARSSNPPLTDDSALSALLQTTDMIRDTRGGEWAQMVEHAQGIVTRYPEFPFGHDLLAYSYLEAADGVDVPDRAHAMREASRREAELTLKLDPLDAGAYAILAELQPSYDYSAQEALLLRGIKTARHPKEALGGLYSGESGLEQNVGRLREGLATQLGAHAVDPWGAPKTAKLAFTYANMGNLTAARGLVARGIQLWPNHSGMRTRTRFIAGFYEDASTALKIFDSLNASQPPDESDAVWRTFVKAKAVHAPQTVSATLSKIREAADKRTIPREVQIMMVAGLGDSKAAFDAANSALDRHEQLEPWFLFTPVTQSLRRDPGFVALASRMGLIKYWRETGKLPDFCTDPKRRSECLPQLLAALKT